MTVPKPTGAAVTPRAAPALGANVRSRALFAGLLEGARPGIGAAAARTLAAAPGTPSASSPAPACAAPHARPPRERPRQEEAADPLDPSARVAAHLGPPPGATLPRVEPAAVPHAVAEARATLEELLPAVVRRIAWAGDARRGSVRLEIGAGELAGARILVHAEDGAVRVEMHVPPGADAAAWRARIAARLHARGIRAESVEVS